MKFIPLDAVLAEINRLIAELVEKGENTMFEQGRISAFEDAKLFLDTLEMKEVEIEKELIEWHKEHFQKSGTFIGMSGFYLTNSSQMELAKHFFELGLSVSNSTKVAIPDIDDVLKENGVNPYSKEAKIIKESYFMAIEKLAQKGEKV